jgi:hypothetical protein
MPPFPRSARISKTHRPFRHSGSQNLRSFRSGEMQLPPGIWRRRIAPQDAIFSSPCVRSRRESWTIAEHPIAAPGALPSLEPVL